MKNKNMFTLYHFKATGLSFLFFTQIISTSAIFDTLKHAVNYLEKQNYMKFHTLITIADTAYSIYGNDSFKEKLFEFVFQDVQYYQIFITEEKNVSKVVQKVERATKFSESSLILIFDFEVSHFIQNVIFDIPRNQYQKNPWLIINPYTYNDSNEEEQFVKSLDNLTRKNIAFDTQLYVLSGTLLLAELNEVFKTCEVAGLSYRFVKEFRHDEALSEISNSLWFRRNNLQQCNLRVAYLDQPPYITKNKDASQITYSARFGNETFYGGYINHLELIEMLSNDLNFTTTWIPTKDNSYGVYDKRTKRWNGLIGLIVNDEADLSNALLTVTSLRSQAITFTVDLQFIKFGLYMAKPSASPSWSTFIDVCDNLYWKSVFGGIMIFSFALTIFSYVLDRGKLPKLYLRKVLSRIFSSIAVVLLAMGAYDVFTRRVRKLYSSNAFKMLIFSVCLLGLLNKEAYTGGLISSLVSKQFQSDINSLEDFLIHPGYQLILRNGTASVHYFSEAKLSPHKEIWENLLENKSNGFVNRPSVAEKVIIENSKNVYFDMLSQIEPMFKNYPCNITRADKTYFHRSQALALTKNSAYLKLFNYKIDQYKEHGILAKMGAFSKIRKEDVKCPSKHIESIGYETIFSAFVVLGVGLICSVFYALAEVIPRHGKHSLKTF